MLKATEVHICRTYRRKSIITDHQLGMQKTFLIKVNAFMYDPSSALLLKGIFLQDQKDAILLQRKTWIKRPWYQKAQESIVRLLEPLP